jgi:hypothetical protein
MKLTNLHRPFRFILAAWPVLFLCGHLAFASNVTGTFYYAGNDRPSNESDAVKKIMKETVSDKKYWLHTFVRSDAGWDPVKSELVRIKSPEEQIIVLYQGNLRLSKTLRKIAPAEDGGYDFEETSKGVLVRKGHAMSLIPVHLEGMVTEYFESGALRAEEFYRDNQLVWDKNWLENGDKYIDSIFYSVDRWPQYEEGEVAMKSHMNNYIVNSRYYSKDLSGTVLLGFVIMENGDLEGVQVVNKSPLPTAQVVRASLESLPGKWKPAVLDNQPVRCYMTFPVNFKVRSDMQFENVEIMGNQIFYNYR